MSLDIEKAINFRSLSKATALPQTILKVFIKQLVKQNKNKPEIINFYIDFLIFLHEEELYVPNDVVTSYYKEKKFIDFSVLIEDTELMDKFRERNELKMKELKKAGLIKTNPEDGPDEVEPVGVSPADSPK